MNTPIDVLMLAVDDYANSGHNYAKALRTLGLKVIALKGCSHPFWYPEQMVMHPDIYEIKDINTLVPFVNSEHLRSIIAASKVVTFKGSYLIDTGIDLGKLKVVVQHGGTVYRDNYENLNKLWEPIADKVIVQCPDLLALGAKDPQWICFPMDTDLIQPVYNSNDCLMISHLPSNQMVKGSENVFRVLDKLKNSYPDLNDKWSYCGVKPNQYPGFWYSNMDVKAQCDVYIEGLSMQVRGKPYGTWGNAALEAAALGKIVVTHSLYEENYASEYGSHPFFIANTDEELMETLVKLIVMDKEEIRTKQINTREWVKEKHSLVATGRKLWEKVYKDLIG